MSTTTRSRTRRTVRVLPAAAIGVLALASCGQATSTGSAAGAPAANAVPVAVSAPATAPAASGGVTAKALATRVGTALKGVRSGTATIAVSGQGAPAGTVTVTADAVTKAARVTATVAGQAYEVRALDGAVYATGPAVQALTGGKTWARVDAATLVQLAAKAPKPTTTPTAVPDPTEIGGLVAKAVSVRDLGPATVGGVTGRTYRVTLPVAAVADLASDSALPLDAQRRTQLRQGVDALAKQGVTVLSADLTLDGRDRPLQLRTATPALAGGVPSVQVTATFSAWGAALRLSAPPASQVTVLDAQALTAIAGRVAASPRPSATAAH